MLIFAAAAFGLAVGSFTNVLIARVPKGEDWVRGASHCPACRHDLPWHDNIPLLSWLWLHRRCRFCGVPISARYPAVELLVATLWVLTAIAFGASVLSLALAYLACISVALVLIDVDTQRLPDSLVLPSYPAVAGMLAIDAWITDDWGNLGRAAAGLAILGLAYGTLWFVYPQGLGLGDVKSAGLLGLVAGYVGWSHLAVAGIAGPLLGGIVVAIGLASGRLTRKSRVPYGPALFAGAWLGILVGAPIASWYVGLVT